MQFFNTVKTDIDQLTNVRGINVPKEDRKALFDYIFKVDQNGQSQYTKDFNKNLSKNLIESAYFTMKEIALFQLPREMESHPLLKNLGTCFDIQQKIIVHTTSKINRNQ